MTQRMIEQATLDHWADKDQQQRDEIVALISACESMTAERDALQAKLDGAEAIVTAYQIWDTAEKVGMDEFVLWTASGQVFLRLKVTHKHEQLDAAALEFVTCDLLDLLNIRVALSSIKGEET